MDNIEKVKCELSTLLSERELLTNRIKNKLDEFQKACKNYSAEIHKTSNNNSINFITTQDISERQTYYHNKYGIRPSPNEAIVLDIAKELKTVTSNDIAIRLGIAKQMQISI